MTETTADMRALVAQIARALVDEPEQVEVDEFDDQGETVLELKVAPNDVGKVIGKQGRTVRSMRAIVSAAAVKMHKRYALEIVEEDEEEDQGTGNR